MHSLLWPGDGPAPVQPPALSDQAMRDLELDALADLLARDRPEVRGYAWRLLAHLPQDVATSAWRGAVTADLLASARLYDGLEAAARQLRILAQHRPERFPAEVGRAARIGARVVELRTYLETLETLAEALGGPGVRAPGLLALRSDVEAVLGTPAVVELGRELPRLSARLDSVRSITIAVNVNDALEPESAVLVGFSDHQVGPESSALLRFTHDTGQRRPVRLFRRTPVDWQGQDPTVQAVLALLEAVATPVEGALHRFRTVRSQELAHLEEEIWLLLGAVRLAREWQAHGLPCAVAEVTAEGEWLAEEAFHPVLARRLPRAGDMTCNPVRFGPAGTVWVLTGPNRGGKTTYLRACGVVQVLGQCGLPVPARSARLQPVSHLFTHFPAPEAAEPGRGRLDEEAERLGGIFRTCAPGDMVLLNEVLAGTSATEGVALAADVLRGLALARCRALYTTHLHELAAQAEQLGRDDGGPCPLGCLTVQTVLDRSVAPPVRRPTYRVLPGVPEGASFFASAIAQRHGVSLPQITALLRERGLLPT